MKDLEKIFSDAFFESTRGRNDIRREKIQSELSRQKKEIKDAWIIEGKNPAYHVRQIAILKKNWPTLHQAITNLIQNNGRRKENILKSI